MKNPPKSVWKNWIHFLAFCFGVGTITFSPGTWATLVGVFIFLLIAWLPIPLYLLVVVILFVAGVWLCEVTSKDLGDENHPGIVWDQMVGFLFAMTHMVVTWKWVLLGFFIYRLFSLWRPWPVTWIHKQAQGGLGIMMDDLVAGVYTLFVLQALAYLMGMAPL